MVLNLANGSFFHDGTHYTTNDSPVSLFIYIERERVRDRQTDRQRQRDRDTDIYVCEWNNFQDNTLRRELS